MLGVRATVGIALIGLATGCVVLAPGGPPARPAKVVVERGGPPPHAPAHGYREKFDRDGVSLIFESALGVYVVVDLDDVFFHDGRYFRYDRGTWYRSSRPREGWIVVHVTELPGKLPGYVGKGRDREKRGRGNGRGDR